MTPEQKAELFFRYWEDGTLTKNLTSPGIMQELNILKPFTVDCGEIDGDCTIVSITFDNVTKFTKKWNTIEKKFIDGKSN